MSTYLLVTTDRRSVPFHAADDREARRIAVAAVRATGTRINYVRPMPAAN